MTSDNQFTSHGPAAVGFQINGSRIDRGVDAYGRHIGVKSHGPVGVHTEGTSGERTGIRSIGDTAVHAEGKDKGVAASGDTAVHAKGRTLGVSAEGDPSGTAGVESSGRWGVVGHGDMDDESTVGVYGDAAGAGIAGVGKHYGGAFGTTFKSPQLYLYPHKIPSRSTHPAAPQEMYPTRMPFNGTVGDIYATQSRDAEGYEGALWLCVQSRDGLHGAYWAQLLTGTPVKGDLPPDVPLER
jgi:hypothetical protein